MRIREKLMLDREGLLREGPINIVIFGDSISQGFFNGYMDQQSVYWNLLKQKLQSYHNYMPVNMICAAVGGATAKELLPRLDSWVLSHKPDLVIVCFGANDVNFPLEDYLDPLRQIFSALNENSCDAIFMTPNMFNTYVAQDTPAQHLPYAHKSAEMQRSGKTDKYYSQAVALAQSMSVPVCDCYAKWKKLSETQDVTMLLSNRINHPTEEMHHLFAQALYEMLLP